MKMIWIERDLLPEYRAYFDSMTLLGPVDKTPDTPFREVGKAQAILASGLNYDEEVIRLAPDLLVVSRTGIGYEKVDVAAMTAAGVAVCNAPDGPTISTAECAVTLMLSVARNIKQIEAELRHELAHGTKRNFYQSYQGIELYQKRLGLVGLGRIGSHVARIASGMGMHITAYDPYLPAETAAEKGIQLAVSLEALLRSSDVVSLHLPLTPENHKFMNAARFAQMKPGAIFVNTARGGHVDEEALIEALQSGHLFGAGLDVTDPEPPQVDNPLLSMQNVVLTPHIASGTADGKHRILTSAIEQILMVLRGEEPPHLVNPEVWPHVRQRWERLQLI